MLHNANTLLRGASTMLHCVYMLCTLPTQKRESVGVGLCLGRRHGRSPVTTLGVQLLDSLSLTRSVALLAVPEQAATSSASQWQQTTSAITEQLIDAAAAQRAFAARLAPGWPAAGGADRRFGPEWWHRPVVHPCVHRLSRNRNQSESHYHALGPLVFFFPS